MSDLEFLTGICQSILNPITDEEKEKIMRHDWIMEQMNPEEDEECDEPLWDIGGIDADESKFYDRYDENGYEIFQDGWDSDGNPRMKHRRWGF